MPNDIYQDFILELYKNPINFGKLDGANRTAKSYNPLCGDKIELFLRVNEKNGVIEEAKFIGSGCAISQATACLLTEEIKGKKLVDLAKYEKEDILRIIKIDLSKNPSRLKCALMSLEVLKKALIQANEKEGNK
ncbi:MAG: iron-sulfur cluster assembly scaffold protein [Candidatus Micrarchaeota archaeon]